ncbi:MAG: hypothetical protein CL885_00835 [Dehalococcoidia bacterium]|nr:hypothetical protein [Dehalococcoidia bacterium]|tara:strand:+ start:626 stop:829 length:204 start_codon:yes stop_codon:yes gene_type:complete
MTNKSKNKKKDELEEHGLGNWGIKALDDCLENIFSEFSSEELDLWVKQEVKLNEILDEREKLRKTNK